MAGIFEMVDRMFAGVVPVADFLWDFPTNYAWYSGIPILGQFSLAILLLLGGSFYFTFKFNFVQMKEFKTGLKLLTAKTCLLYTSTRRMGCWIPCRSPP